VGSAQANESIFDDAEKLPKLFNSELVVNQGPPLAAVQATAHVKFTFASCSPKRFFANVEDAGNVLVVKVNLYPNQRECRAMPVKRTYTVQFSSDFGLNAKPVVLLNPLDQDSKFYRDSEEPAAEKQDNKAIYEALNVPALNEDPDFGSMDFVKKVGGLKCSQMYYGEGFAYSCKLSENNNAELIYKALDVEAVNLNPGIAGSYRLGKSVGGLECVKSSVVYPNAQPDFTCSL